MAGPPSYPANTDLNTHTSPPTTSSHSNVPFTPSATSVADSSDNELELTPVHSPGGPQYDDLPPSYDEAQHQAVHDSRNGIAPVDPNQIEAHRITSNEGPDEAEVWEYRVKGEQTDPASEREEAPDYANYTNDKATSVPVQYAGGSASSSSAPDLAAAMLSQALEFTRNEPNADAQYAPHLNRLIAIPEERAPGQFANEHRQFLGAYAEVLRGHSVRPAEFADFLYGLNVLATVTNTTARDLLDDSSNEGAPSAIVHDYIRGANEAFFAPRGLTVSFRSEPALLDSLPIPAGRRASILEDFLEVTRGAQWRAKQLYPWIEALDADVDGNKAPSERRLRLHETGVRYVSQRKPSDASASHDDYPVEKLHIHHSEEDEDPPHSVPEPSEGMRHGHGHHGRGGHHHPRSQRGGHWSPFGMPGHGPFGAPGRGPWGAPGNGPFGRPGRGSCGRRGRSYADCRGPSGPSQQGDAWRGNEWAEVGKELGKIGEQFGKAMGDWGIDFGKRANAWGLEVGKMASGSGSQQRSASGPAYGQVHDDLPPSYESPHGQQSGVVHGDCKVDLSSSTSTVDKGKSKEKDIDIDIDDDSDTSSISSDSSSSSDDEEYPDTDAIYNARLRAIDASASAQKGKKSSEEIARERDIAIEKAQMEKENMDLKTASKLSRRAANRDLRQRRRELKRQHKQKKRELRSSYDRKGKGKAKKSKEWKEAKKEFKDKKKELRKEKWSARKEWREARNESLRSRRDIGASSSFQGPHQGGDQGKQDVLVWLVIENLGP
ncbi:hypothetical protein GMOD_00001291 [Pyrenophora seminiperda CCB06]|uniref:Uncharacterized protein n=1 Tax=Pyrenophora seminiperda CCB06 TaxID=1302712 RepID=A0A3M7LYV5_9PLEO|nr:hypothetical protein GMOD_00001291 [Pyrenophora seminiperda CCB06]